jgi:hypothetical protein
MKNIFFIVILLSLSHLGVSQTKDRDYYLDLSKALGYSYGIELTNDIIKVKFPDLAKKALMAQLDFNLAHGKSVEWIVDEISQVMNLSENEFKKQLISKIGGQFDLENFSHSEADGHLRNFKEERIKGNHELYQEFVQILLRHNPIYKSNPAKEYLNGYRTVLNTDNHPKSKGLNVSIEYPKSWLEQEGKRPNIVKLIKSYDGSCNITILIKDLISEMGAETANLSKEDLKYFKSHEFAMEMYNDVFTHSYGKEIITAMGLEEVADYSFNKTKVDGQPAMSAKASGKIKRGIVDMRVYTINYMIIYKNYAVNIGSMISGLDGNLDDQKNKYEMLSDLIVSSLIFKDKW